MTNINDVVGESIISKIKEYRFSDTLKSVIGQDNYKCMKDSLYRRFYEKRITEKRVPLVYAWMKNYEDTSFYSWAVDAIAQNVASLPFIINDRYAPLKFLFQAAFNYQAPPDADWATAFATRKSAFVGNAMIGDIYRVWQDYLEAYMDVKLKISDDTNKIRKKAKEITVDSIAFVTGQSWIYGGFLLGGNALSGKETNWEQLGMTVLSLAIFAPLIGPFQSMIYKAIRKAVKLPEKAEFDFKQYAPYF